jgi:dTDP-4-dehydrorhamnose reductase
MLGKDLLQTIQTEKSKSGTPSAPPPAQLILLDLPDFDITQSNTSDRIVKLAPTLTIHLAAYTDVDGCERDSERAWQTNSIGTRNVAIACRTLDIPMIHVSTDYVFDGTKPAPYAEWDLPSPASVYGQTKLDGELWVKKLVRRFFVVRTSWLYGEGGHNFIAAILKKAKQTNVIKVVADQIGSPTYTKDLATAIRQLSQTEEFGTYHITNSGWTSWFEFAKAIIETRIELATDRQETPLCCDILPIDSNQLDRPAQRPKNSRLLNFMWERVFGKPLRPWKEALDEYLGVNRAKH